MPSRFRAVPLFQYTIEGPVKLELLEPIPPLALLPLA